MFDWERSLPDEMTPGSESQPPRRRSRAGEGSGSGRRRNGTPPGSVEEPIDFRAAAAFVGGARPGRVDEDAPHDARGHGEKVGAILPVDARDVD